MTCSRLARPSRRAARGCAPEQARRYQPSNYRLCRSSLPGTLLQCPPTLLRAADPPRRGPRPRRTGEYRSPDERAPEYRTPDGREPDSWSPDGQSPRGRSGARRSTPDPRPGTSRALVIAVLAVVVAAGLGWAAYHSLRGGGHASPGSASHPPGARQTGTRAVVLNPVNAAGFDENGQDARLAIDGNPSTPCVTSCDKGSPDFGGPKRRSGLILDMGHPV